MAKRSRFRRLPTSVLVLVAGLVLLLHLFYPLPYVYRVLRFQDADFGDIHIFPARRIEAPAVAREVPVALAPWVDAAIARRADVSELDELLEATATSAFLVVRRGKLVVERYSQGHDATSLQNTFSVSKSIASLAVGLAVRDGRLGLGDPITRHLPELARRDERFSAITIEHLLDMRSGIRYRSGVDFPFVDADDALVYYHPNLAAVALKRTRIEAPLGAFRYNNYNPPLLGLALRRATDEAVSAYLERELWAPLGAEAAAGWTTDDRGLERMESGFHARGRDLARLALLLLDDGRRAERQVVPEGWLEQTTRLPNGAEVETFDGRSWVYRLGWWIVPRPEGRSDYCGIGRYGQFLYLSPAHDVAIVRTGPGRGDWGDRDWTELFYAVAEEIAIDGGSDPIAALGS